MEESQSQSVTTTTTSMEVEEETVHQGEVQSAPIGGEEAVSQEETQRISAETGEGASVEGETPPKEGDAVPPPPPAIPSSEVEADIPPPPKEEEEEKEDKIPPKINPSLESQKELAVSPSSEEEDKAVTGDGAVDKAVVIPEVTPEEDAVMTEVSPPGGSMEDTAGPQKDAVPEDITSTTTVQDIDTSEKFKKVGGAYQCKICGEKLRNHFHLNSHMRRHSVRYRCKICSEVCQNKHQLLLHMKLHKSEAVREYKCAICQMEFNNRFQMSCHMKAHKKLRTPKPLPISPDIATLTTTTTTHGGEMSVEPEVELTARNQNRRDYHTLHHGARRISGSRSRSVSTDTDQTQTPKKINDQLEPEEISTMTTPTSKQFQCKLCEKICRDRFGLSGHMKTHRKDIKPVPFLKAPVKVPPPPSDIEEFILTGKFVLTPSQKRHLELTAPLPVHDGPLHFRRFIRNPNRYVKLKPFKCDKCPYAAVESFSLSLHVRLVHEEIIPQKCDFCWKSFPTKETRRRHVRAYHRGEKVAARNGNAPETQTDLNGQADDENDKTETEADGGNELTVQPEA